MSSPRLLDEVRRVIRARHYSHRTERAYIGWIKRFLYFNGYRHPDERRDRLWPDLSGEKLATLL